jgi:ABC-type uncharacterized transport system permease subunit
VFASYMTALPEKIKAPAFSIKAVARYFTGVPLYYQGEVLMDIKNYNYEIVQCKQRNLD